MTITCPECGANFDPFERGESCQAVRGGVCLNGFPVTGACRGLDGVPLCMNEEWCGRLYPTGKPEHGTGDDPRGLAEGLSGGPAELRKEGR